MIHGCRHVLPAVLPQSAEGDFTYMTKLKLDKEVGGWGFADEMDLRFAFTCIIAYVIACDITYVITYGRTYVITYVIACDIIYVITYMITYGTIYVITYVITYPICLECTISYIEYISKLISRCSSRDMFGWKIKSGRFGTSGDTYGSGRSTGSRFGPSRSQNASLDRSTGQSQTA